jgi:DNA-binding NarL/FixJ family response regulator
VGETLGGLVSIALIEPNALDAARLKELVLRGSVRAEVADVLSSETRDFAGAEIIMAGLQALDARDKELITRLRDGFPKVPVIVLAGFDDPDLVSEAVSLGAAHVLIKRDLTADKLSSVIRYFVHYNHPAPVRPTP